MYVVCKLHAASEEGKLLTQWHVSHQLNCLLPPSIVTIACCPLMLVAYVHITYWVTWPLTRIGLFLLSPQPIAMSDCLSVCHEHCLKLAIVRWCHCSMMHPHLLSRLWCPRPRLWVPRPRLISPKTKKHNSITDWLKNHYSRNRVMCSHDQDVTVNHSRIQVNTKQRLVNKALLTIILRKKQPNGQDWDVQYQDFEK